MMKKNLHLLLLRKHKFVVEQNGDISKVAYPNSAENDVTYDCLDSTN